MTKGEKKVWAAMYAAFLMDRMAYDMSHSHPSSGGFEASKRAQQEREEANEHTAIEHACYAVRALRERLPDIVKGFGADSDVTTMLREMVDDPRPPTPSAGPTVRVGIRVTTDGKLRYTIRADQNIQLVHDPESDVPISDWPHPNRAICIRPGDTFDLETTLRMRY